MKSRWIVCVFALLVGCGDDATNGGHGGAGGVGGVAGTGGEPSVETLCDAMRGSAGGAAGTGGTGDTCVGNVCPCNVAGLHDAVRTGGGPYTFDCTGPTTIVVDEAQDEFLIERNVSLDGEGDLTVLFGSFQVYETVTAELQGLTLACGGVSVGFGTLVIANSRILESPGDGVRSIGGLLEITNTTVSKSGGNGIANGGPMTMTNSTVSENGGWGITTVVNRIGCGPNVITDSVITGNGNGSISVCGEMTISNTVIDGHCTGGLHVTSEGGNIESPGDTCGFDHATDQINVSPDDLKLGELGDNGGPTMTHALGTGSIAIDSIPEADCVDPDGEPLTTDQRGEPRPAGDGCDVGAFELQP